MKRQFRRLSPALVGLLSFLAGTTLFSFNARAALLGAGNTVQAFYYNSVFASPEGELAVGAATSNPASLTAAVDYQLGAADGSLIHIGDTQIVITNQVAGSFCFSGNIGTACTDQIDGFDFKFTGENILGVSVDPSSAAGFLPALFSPHLGLQLLSNNEIQVDLTGDAPAIGDKLVLDLSFSPTISTTPLPAAFPLFATGLGVMGFLAKRRKRKAALAA